MLLAGLTRFAFEAERQRHRVYFGTAAIPPLVWGFVDDSLQGLTALVVDDDSDIRKSIARILRLAGAEVSVTGSVEDALQRLEENKWDVVVSDIGMPRLSGYDLIRRARSEAIAFR